MAKEKIDKLEEKKRELEKELDKIQHELDDSLDRVRTDVSTHLHPTEIIKRHPLPVVGFSVLLGFLAGNKKSNHSSGSSDSSFNSLLWTELKKLATKKSLSLLTDYLENALLDEEREGPSQNGAVKKD